MPRITVNISEETERWLQEEADALGVSKARTGGHCIELIQNTVDHIDLHQSSVGDDSVATGDVDLDDVLDRLAQLEDRVDDLENDDESVAPAQVDVAGSGLSDESDEPSASKQPAASGDSASKQTESSPVAPAQTPGEDGEDVVAAFREFLQDRPPRTEHGTAATVATLRILREQGPMKTGELKDVVFEAIDSDDYDDARSMWQSIQRYFDDLPGFEKAGYGKWGYAGDDIVLEALADEDVDIYDPTEEF